MPIRKCSGISKNDPGATVPSYLERSNSQKLSTGPESNFGKTVVPNLIGCTSRSVRVARNWFKTCRFVSSSARARARIRSRFANAITLSRSAGCAAFTDLEVRSEEHTSELQSPDHLV